LPYPYPFRLESPSHGIVELNVNEWCGVHRHCTNTASEAHDLLEE
jgi:hypothetical protein